MVGRASPVCSSALGVLCPLSIVRKPSWFVNIILPVHCGSLFFCLGWFAFPSIWMVYLRQQTGPLKLSKVKKKKKSSQLMILAQST